MLIDFFVIKMYLYIQLITVLAELYCKNILFYMIIVLFSISIIYFFYLLFSSLDSYVKKYILSMEAAYCKKMFLSDLW